MPPKRQFEATVFVLDLCCSEETRERQRVCLGQLLSLAGQSEDTTRSQDVFRLVVCGVPPALQDNALAYSGLLVPQDWQVYPRDGHLLRYLEQLHNVCQHPAHPADIYQAIYLACHHFTNDSQVLSCQYKRVLVLSELETEPPAEAMFRRHVEDLRKYLSSADIWLYVLSGPVTAVPVLRSEEDVQRWARQLPSADTASKFQRAHLAALRQLLHEGVVCERQLGLHLQASHCPEGKPPFPWYAELTIGDQIAFKVNVIKLVGDSANLLFPSDSEDESSDEDEEELEASEEDVEDEGEEGEDDEVCEVVDKETGEPVSEWTECYRLHGHIVALSEERDKELDEAIAEDEERCLELKYFLPLQHVSPLYLEEESMCMVEADVREDEEWSEALEVLEAAMRQQQVAAIVKRVYNRGPQFQAKPHLLWPCLEHDSGCLLLAEWIPAHEHEQSDAHLVCGGGWPGLHVSGQELVKPETESETARREVCALLDALDVSLLQAKGRLPALLAPAPHLLLEPELLSQCEWWCRGHEMSEQQLEELDALPEDSERLDRWVPEHEPSPGMPHSDTPATTGQDLELLEHVLEDLDQGPDPNSLLYDLFDK